GQRLAAAEEIRPPAWKAIAGIRAEIAGVEATAADIRRSLDASHAGDRQRRADATAAGEDLKRIAAESARARAAIDAIQERIGALRAADGPTTDQLQGQLTTLNAQYTKAKAQWKASRGVLHDAIEAIYVNPHPRAAVAQMPDSTPFLLLPVRIETRFVPGSGAAGSGAELLLRVYPDDIAVHTHEDELTDREVGEGERYWRTIFDIEKGEGTDKASARTESWKTFAELFGPSRAAWVARSTRPTNWGDLATIASADDLTFPVHDLTRVASWSRAPRTRVMPDRFVVLLYQGAAVQEIVGNAIPDELYLGPEPLDLVAEDDQQDPEDAEDSFVTVNGQLTFGSNYDWTSNFDRAVEQGMGFRIPLPDPAAQQGFDRIVVLGVMASAGAGAAQTMLETLLANHHHSPRGLTLLRQGTATNNVDGQGSGYSVNDSLEQTREVTGLDVPLFVETSDTDGRTLADALGIGYPTLQYVFNSDNTDGREAVAMNRALYPGTLGYYFDTLLRVMDEPARDRVREFFVTQVTGRGPLAALRVGDQPYGILLTSDFAHWTNPPDRVGAPGGGDRFLDGLVAVLRRFDAVWQSILPKLAWAGKQGASAGEVLLDVLGLQAASATFAQRVGYSADYLINLVDFQVGGDAFDDVIANALKDLSVTAWLRALGYDPTAAGVDARPQLLRLIYQHYTTPIDAANLVDAVPLSETAGIREYDPVAHRNYLHWLRDATTLETLSSQNFGGAPRPSALLYLKLRHALLLELNKSAVRWLVGKGYDASVTMAARTFYNIRADTPRPVGAAVAAGTAAQAG
ncbi:MAG TPA: hypothetical protein VNH46_08995, partial [Gemmatimonadales bacterium]|nr:hypothetical protein [Gemmatimonadales bacterium]